MGKQKKHMLLMLLLLVILAGGYFGLQVYNDWAEQKEKDRTADESIVLVDYAPGDITALSYDYNGVAYQFQREGEGWIYTEDTALPIDGGSLEDMAERIAVIEAEQKIENVTDLSQYGLETPARTIRVTAADEEYTIYLGDYNSMINKYYMYMEGGSATVYTVNANTYTAFSRDLESLVEKEEVSGGDAAPGVSEGDAG